MKVKDIAGSKCRSSRTEGSGEGGVIGYMDKASIDANPSFDYRIQLKEAQPDGHTTTSRCNRAELSL